jgi:hydroxymethylglutaryl-CoA synthase
MNSTKQSTSEIQIQLLGDKGYNQLQKMFSFLSSMKMILTHPNSTKSSSPSSRVMESLDLSHPSSTSTSTSTSTTTSTLGRANLELQNKLQLLSILINILTYRLMEMHHQQHTLVKDFFVTILQKGYHTRMIDGQTRQELLSKVPYEDPVLSTGLPLFVALWQVLHYHMEQEVPHILLRENILKEQWLLLHSIVTSFTLDMSSSFIQVEEDDDVMLKKQLCSYMATHGKRWQATMLLLIDLLAVGSEGLTPERLGFLRRIGEYIEWEGTLAHDIARYPHSMPEEEVTVPNVYAFWLRQKKISIPIGEATDKYASAFRSLMDNISIQRWNQIVNEKESKEDGFFSLNAVQTVVELIRQNYLKKDGRRPRTESF